MIRLNMTRDELMKELSSDEQWILDRLRGIRIKFRRFINDKRTEGIFHKCWYTTPNHNRVCVTYTKENNCIACYTFFKVIGDDGKVRYIFNFFSPMTNRLSRCFLFTNHFVERLKEREGKKFETWFQERVETQETTFEPINYEYNGDSKQCFAIMNGFMAFGYYTDSFDVVFTTLINKEQEKDNQQGMHEEAFQDNCEKQRLYNNAMLRKYGNVA